MTPNLINEGYNEASGAELAELRKALEIGYTQPVTGTGYDALRVESLESTLKLLTYQAQHIRLWAQIAKLEAFSTVEEYNKLTSYGDEGGAFVASGALPEEEDSTYVRADQKVKYLGSTRKVHHPATLVRTVPADLIAQETANGALWLMGKLNSGLYYADSDNQTLEFNGLTAQIEDGAVTGTVIDLRGSPLSKDDIENGAQTIVDNYGQPMKLFSNAKVFSDFSKIYHASQRTTFGQGGQVGTPITGYNTLAGNISFEPDMFVKRGSIIGSAHANAPTAPTVTFTVQGATVTGSLFGAADAGAYKYQVTAVNKYGESAGSTLSAGQTVVAAGSITLSIIDGAGTYPATCYKIYRTEKAGGIAYFIGYVKPRAGGVGAYTSPTTFVDLNAYLPRCFSGLLLDMSVQSLAFKQLLPMIKMPLAITQPAISWMQLLYGTPIVYAPAKNVVLRNIGVAS